MTTEQLEDQRIDVLDRLWSGRCACGFIARSMRHFADEPTELDDWGRMSTIQALAVMVGYVGVDIETAHRTVSGWEQWCVLPE